MDSLIEFPLEGGGKLYVEMSESTLHYLSAEHNNWQNSSQCSTASFLRHNIANDWSCKLDTVAVYQ